MKILTTICIVIAAATLQAQDRGGVERAVAVMHPTKDSQVSGIVTFTRQGDGIRVEAQFRGLSPGEHGFHIHQFGDCSAPDATSAGDHFNPTEMPHAAPDAHKRHMGDLGNITADSEGNATYDRLDEHLKLEGEHSIIGRAVIVHAKADDLKTQPTGDAGGRLACGVIGAAKAR